MKKYKKLTYTHMDISGMKWRFRGSRPVSALADNIMREVLGEKKFNKGIRNGTI